MSKPSSEGFRKASDNPNTSFSHYGFGTGLVRISRWLFTSLYGQNTALVRVKFGTRIKDVFGAYMIRICGSQQKDSGSHHEGHVERTKGLTKHGFGTMLSSANLLHDVLQLNWCKRSAQWQSHGI